MESDVPLDYAVFQLSPRRSRCELFVSYDGTMEKLASGAVKHFVTHLKVAEEQVALPGKSIKLDVQRNKNVETWFTKGTVERFVRFVSTPEVLEMVTTFDAEMSQLEAARKIYSQGGDGHGHESGTSGGVANGGTAASDATKKELLRAIDVRLSALKQDLITAYIRASNAGFNPENVSDLEFFADHFGAHRLSEACSKFITLTQRRSDLFSSSNTISTWKTSSDSILRSSTCSDMSLDDPFDDQPRPSTSTTGKLTIPSQCFSRELSPNPNPIDDVDERNNIKEKDFDNDKDQKKSMGSTTSDTTMVTESTSIGKPQLTRRLSVQERISLFENKAQNSPSIATTLPSTGGKPELRRLSSDVNSSTDKAVLRRWSGASDMSIDVSAERKDLDTNATTSTPSSRSVFSPKFSSDHKSEEGDKDSQIPVRAKLGPQLSVSSGCVSEVKESVLSESISKMPSFPGRSRGKDQSSGAGVRSRAEEFGSPVKCVTKENHEGLSGEGVQPQGETTNVSEKFATKTEGMFVSSQSVSNYDEVEDQQVIRSKFSGFQGRKIEDGLDSAISEVHIRAVIQNTEVEVDTVAAQPRWRSLSEVKEARPKEFEPSQNQSESISMQMGNSVFGSEQATIRGARKEYGSNVGGRQMYSAERHLKENTEALTPPSSVPTDQAQRLRQAKLNQGVNDELKMKANELEKLFAEHKLRLPSSDPSNSVRRIRPADLAKEVVTIRSTTITGPEPENSFSEMDMENLNSSPLAKTSDSHDYDVTPKHNIYSLSFLDDSKGTLYQKYMHKRDAKLKEDWSLNRPEKEAQMKAMHDSLEKSRAEMKFKLASSTNKSNSAYGIRRRDGKMRSLNDESARKRDQLTDQFVSDEDEVQADFLGKKISETYLGDSSSKNVQNKRVQTNKNLSSPSTRKPTGPIHRSSSKPSNSATGRRRMPYDNPLAQSVPNFSDLKKENTRPLPGGSKPVRPQGRNHARKKSTSEDFPLVSEEKQRRFQTLRKNTATTMELNDSRNSDDVNDPRFIPPQYQWEDNDDCEKSSNDMESKIFLRKGNGIEHIPNSSMAISKATLMGEAARNGHSFGTEEMKEVANDGEQEYETEIVEESTYKSGNSGYENSDALRFVSQATFTLESPGESPGSWNSRLQNPFAFSHEVSDIDASDSPTRSPASWNFQSLSQSELEAAKMRKKWGAAQKPIVGIDSSHSPSRRDVNRGLKRFLKFGRKNRTENLADWISATTSEGDDSEDGRDIANRSSEDLRKSRMGFSQSHNSDEGFNGNDLFNEQVQALRSSNPMPPSNFKLRDELLSGSSLKAPKSFFSLSNFRSKGNDSKPR